MNFNISLFNKLESSLCIDRKKKFFMEIYLEK